MIEKDAILIDNKRGYIWVYWKGYEKPLIFAFNPKTHQNIGEYYKTHYSMDCEIMKLN